MKNKLILIGIMVVIAMALALTGCGSAEEEGGDEKTASGNIPSKIGYWGGTCESPIYIAYEKGFFQEAGIDPELLVITTDTTTLMANGELDCYELTPDQFMPIKNGTEVSIIDSLHTGCIQGAATKESGIKSCADLEGKKVAINNQGEITQILASSEMVKMGKDPKKVEWVIYPNDQKIQAMEKGEIDAFVAYDPFGEIAAQQGYTKFFSNTFDDGLKDVLCCFIGLNNKTMEENPELAGRLSQAFKKACDYLEANPEEAAELIMEKEYIAGDADINKKLITDYTWVAGDKELIDSSAREIWHQVYRAGALDEEVSEDELEEWIDGMVKKMVKFEGKSE